MSSDDILAGLGLVVVLAMACRLLADWLRLPAIVLLLPVGFAAGAATDVVDPTRLLGDAYQPLVSLGVGLILFEAGLRLRLHELHGGIRGVVLRLIPIGIVVTLVGVAATVGLLVTGWGSALVLGAILVVSGPTVVLPLLAFVRPTRRVRSVLKWEGVLIDPIGALLGVLAFELVQASSTGRDGYHAAELLVSLLVGTAIGALGAAALQLLLHGIQREAPNQGIAATLMIVTGTVVAADLVHDDSGLVAATVAGALLANQTALDLSTVLGFHTAVVQLLIAILFVLISASVSPSQVLDLLPQGIALVAVMVLVLRPLSVALGTWRSALSLPERQLAAWLAPRGIVAAATASAFGPQLAEDGVPGAEHILPLAFIAIFGTVVLYGLTAPWVARRLGLAGAGANIVLVVGGHAWARALAAAMKSAGLGVRLWTGRAEEQAAARAAGLDAGNARLGVDLASREEELEEVTDALLLTGSDDFNALAAFELRDDLGHGHVYRLVPEAGLLDLEPAYAEGNTLFTADLTYAELTRRFDAGARMVAAPAASSGMIPLLAVTAHGRLRVATVGRPLGAAGGDTVVYLADAPT